MPNKNLVLFDFDGTLIKTDSIKLYCQFQSDNKLMFYFYYYIVYRFISLFNDKSVKANLILGFKKKNKSNFESFLTNFMFDDSIKLVESAKQNGRIPIVISASFVEIIGEFVNEILNCQLIANTLDKNIDVNGKEKLRQLRKFYPKAMISEAYGNTEGDFPMMREAQVAYLRKSNGILEKWIG